MLTKGVKKYLANPIIGILPFALYIILHTLAVLPEQYSLIISILATFATEFVLRRYFKSRIHGLPFYITASALIVATMIYFLFGGSIENTNTYVLIVEILIVLQLMLFRLAKTFLKARLFQDKSFLDKTLLDDFFFTATILQYAFTAHILVLFACSQIAGLHLSPIMNFILYVVFPLLIVVGLFVYQLIKTKYLVSKLHQEEWLPIVKEDGEVTGKIARTVSRNLANKYMHPVVRVALVCGKEVYLQKRDSNYIVDPEKLDHPFEKHMLFRHEINQAAKNCIKRILGRNTDKEPEFVFKYMFENTITNRLIFFFVVRIDNESQVKRTQNMTGKFWTVKQIDNEFGDGVFSEFFELEYEYLKHMILLEDADNLLAKGMMKKPNDTIVS